MHLCVKFCILPDEYGINEINKNYVKCSRAAIGHTCKMILLENCSCYLFVLFFRRFFNIICTHILKHEDVCKITCQLSFRV